MQGERRIAVFFLAMLLAWAVFSCALAGSGDINGDGLFDEKDSETLREYLVGNIEEINSVVADIDQDGSVGLSGLVTLERYLLSGDRPGDGVVTSREIVYGTSVMGRDLTCTIIEPERVERTVLAVFAIHGFEDAYDHDGEALKALAERLISHFEAQDTMYGTRLMIVPCANPDGMIDGNSAEGFGRGNRYGININANFDASHKPERLGRNYTQQPFSAPESRGLRDLVNTWKPDVVVDVHGWNSYTYGDSELASIFREEMDKPHNANFDSKQHGAFTLWAHNQGAQALKVEITQGELENTNIVRCFERIVAHNYAEDSGSFTPDSRYADLKETSGYALKRENITTYIDMNGTEYGYISGTNDRCVIERIYDNGWMRVRYPIKEGEKIAYCRSDAFLDPDEAIDPLEAWNGRKYIPVYARSDKKWRIDSIAPDRTYYAIAETEDAYMVTYPAENNRGWRFGWCDRNQVVLAEQNHTITITTSAEEKPKQQYTGTLLAAGVQIDGGQAFDLPIYVQAEDMTALRLWIEYDDGALELIGAEDGGTMQGFTTGNEPGQSPYLILWTDSAAGETKLDGKLVTLHFRARPTSSEQETPLLVYAKTGDALTSGLDNIKITLAPYVPSENTDI